MGDGVFAVNRTVILLLFTTYVTELYLCKGEIRRGVGPYKPTRRSSTVGIRGRSVVSFMVSGKGDCGYGHADMTKKEIRLNRDYEATRLENKGIKAHKRAFFRQN